MIKTYVKRPIPIKALQWTGMNLEECKAFAGPALDVQYPTLDNSVILLVLDTLEGKMQVPYGAYIIQGVNGEFYACKESIFNKTYQEVK